VIFEINWSDIDSICLSGTQYFQQLKRRNVNTFKKPEKLADCDPGKSKAPEDRILQRQLLAQKIGKLLALYWLKNKETMPRDSTIGAPITRQ
jgi:hypothetical protein